MPNDEEGGTKGFHEHDIELGRYDYQWNGHSFQVYEIESLVSYDSVDKKHYILYPRQSDDIVKGQSKTVDSLIEAATTHG